MVDVSDWYIIELQNLINQNTYQIYSNIAY